jgi:hypothetical protein
MAWPEALGTVDNRRKGRGDDHMLNRRCAFLDRLQHTSRSNDCRVNQILVCSVMSSVSAELATHFLNIGDVEMKRAGSVEHSFKRRV